MTHCELLQDVMAQSFTTRMRPSLVVSEALCWERTGDRHPLLEASSPCWIAKQCPSVVFDFRRRCRVAD